MDDTSPPRRRFAAERRHRLALGSIAAASTLAVTACEDPPTFQDAQFTSVEACAAAGYPDDLCRAARNGAEIEHQRTAPTFTSLASCEGDWGTGQCQETAIQQPGHPSLTSVFVPALAGFVVGRSLQRRYYDEGPSSIYYYGGGNWGSPIYRSRAGSTVTLANSGGKMVATPVNVNTRTVAAKGFGGRGFSRGGSWGG